MTTLTEDIAAYEEIRAELELDHFGEWVVVHNGALTGTYESFDAAAREAVRKYGRGPYLIRQVGAAPPALPISVVAHPVS